MQHVAEKHPVGGSDAGAVQAFASTLRGKLIDPSDDGYESARKVYNAMIDRRPRLIAKVADVADVISCVNFGREENLRIAIRGGGHNAGGLGVCDDGLVIDLSSINYVYVDPAKKTVRCGGGTTWVCSGSRHAPVWPGRALGHHLHNRRSRPNARWRHGASHAAVRSHHRQPALG